MKKCFFFLFLICAACSNFQKVSTPNKLTAGRQDNDNFNGFIITDPNRHASPLANVQVQIAKMNEDLRGTFKLTEFATVFTGFSPVLNDETPIVNPCRVTIYDFKKHKINPKDKILIEIEADSTLNSTEPAPLKLTFGSTEDIKTLDDPDVEKGWRIYETRNYVPYDGADNLKWLYVLNGERKTIRAVEGPVWPGKSNPFKGSITCDQLNMPPN